MEHINISTLQLFQNAMFTHLYTPLHIFIQLPNVQQPIFFDEVSLVTIPGSPSKNIF